MIIICLCYFKMAKEMSVSCDFIEKKLNCMLPDNTMDKLLKVQTRSGKHMFREDIYTRTLKYRRWNNELRPFRSLKKRVARIFRKRNSFSDSSRAISTQTIVNEIPESHNTEEKDSETDSDRQSIHSNWSELMPVETSKSKETLSTNILQRKRTVRNIVLVPYKPKPNNWGSWRVKSPYTASIVASPNFDSNDQIQENFDSNNKIQEKNQEDKLTYIPHSPYYEPLHSPQYYENV